MTFDEYATERQKTAIYPKGLTYPTLGMCSEAGEFAGKIKKWQRDGTISWPDLVEELGDVLWYVDALAYELGITLKSVAQRNIKKLADRAARGTLAGSGDKR